MLKDLHTERQIEAAARGQEAIPSWLFCRRVDGLLHVHNLRDRVFYELLTKAEWRKVRFHDLRHTFVQQGESLVYVKDQGATPSRSRWTLYGHLIPGGTNKR